jgi:hypothetical protein
MDCLGIEPTGNKRFTDAYCIEPWRSGFLQSKVSGSGVSAPGNYTLRISVPAGWPGPLGSKAERLVLAQAHKPAMAYMYTQWQPGWRNEMHIWSLATYEWSRFPGLYVSLRAEGIDPTQLDPLIETLAARAAAYVTGLPKNVGTERP